MHPRTRRILLAGAAGALAWSAAEALASQRLLRVAALAVLGAGSAMALQPPASVKAQAAEQRVAVVENRMGNIGNNTDMGALSGSATLADTISFCNSIKDRLNTIYANARS